MNVHGRKSVALALVSALLVSSPALAFNKRIRAEDREYPYTANIPACEDTGVISKVVGRFEDRERDYRNSNLSIVEVRDVRPVAFRPNGPDLIPRRYCTAQVVTSDLVKRRLDYFVVEDASVIGWTWGVEWCVSGLDFSHTYGGRCKGARP
ncbi:MAG: hypothetical protein K2P80_06565 [Beijerinckiaceae bacterium]|nr:hypothetical protein [Beijerinckiaceae bacterium]